MESRRKARLERSSIKRNTSSNRRLRKATLSLSNVELYSPFSWTTFVAVFETQFRKPRKICVHTTKITTKLVFLLSIFWPAEIFSEWIKVIKVVVEIEHWDLRAAFSSRLTSWALPISFGRWLILSDGTIKSGRDLVSGSNLELIRRLPSE